MRADSFDRGEALPSDYQRQRQGNKHVQGGNDGGSSTCETAAPISRTWLFVERGSPAALLVTGLVWLMITVGKGMVVDVGREIQGDEKLE